MSIQTAQINDLQGLARISNQVDVSCTILIPVESAMIVFNNPTGNIILLPLVAPLNEGAASIQAFTVNDVVNNVITRSHSLDTDFVDVTLFDPSGRIVNCQVDVTRYTVTLNLKRIQIVGTWKFLVERL